MRTAPRLRWAVGAIALAACGWAQSIIDVAETGPDYKIQGEYLGQCDGAKLAAQIAGWGGDTYKVTFLPGGFPGAGWDNQTKSECWGKTEGDKVTISGGGGWAAAIVGQDLGGTNPDGKAFKLSRVTRQSPTLGAKAPEGAIVLLGPDQQPDLSAWAKGKVHANGWLCTKPEQPITKAGFTNFKLHLEVMLPYEPQNRDQGRSNSGVYLQDRYEVQVLDTFGIRVGKGKPDGNVMGDIYSKAGALTNASLPPLTWQTYDIDFTAAKWDGNAKIKNATVTIRFNGVLIHDQSEISACTGGNGHQENAEPGPLMLQFHEHQVFYRNLWLVETK